MSHKLSGTGIRLQCWVNMTPPHHPDLTSTLHAGTRRQQRFCKTVHGNLVQQQHYIWQIKCHSFATYSDVIENCLVKTVSLSVSRLARSAWASSGYRVWSPYWAGSPDIDWDTEHRPDPSVITCVAWHLGPLELDSAPCQRMIMLRLLVRYTNLRIKKKRVWRSSFI